MYDIERKEKILQILKEKKSCSVAQLAKALCFSEATIRRDLNQLDREMKVRKTFGGAVIVDRYAAEVPLAVRQAENTAVKEALGRAAASCLRDDLTIFLASSTTVACILPYLTGYKGLTVVTNSPDIPQQLSATDIAVYCTGGKYLHHSNAYVGEFARSMIRSINADLMFFSARGVGLDGRITNSSTDDDIHRAMMENAAQTCLLVDSSKIGKIYPFTFARLKEVDTVITDHPLPAPLEHVHTIIAKL